MLLDAGGPGIVTLQLDSSEAELCEIWQVDGKSIPVLDAIAQAAMLLGALEDAIMLLNISLGPVDWDVELFVVDRACRLLPLLKLELFTSGAVGILRVFSLLT